MVRIILIALLLCTPVMAQTHTYPATDTANVYINTNQFILGVQVGPKTFSTLPAEVNGTLIYCSDCQVTNPCISGGTGAIASGINGVWNCGGSNGGGVSGSGITSTIPLWTNGPASVLGNSGFTQSTTTNGYQFIFSGRGDLTDSEIDGATQTVAGQAAGNLTLQGGANTGDSNPTCNLAQIFMEGEDREGASTGGSIGIQAGCFGGLATGAEVDVGQGSGTVGGNVVLSGGSTNLYPNALITIDGGNNSSVDGNITIQGGGNNAGSGGLILVEGTLIYLGEGASNPTYFSRIDFGSLAAPATGGLVALASGKGAALWCTDCRGPQDSATWGSVAASGGTGSLIIYDGTNWRVH